MTITVGVDTYISLADARSYATANGLTLPASNTDAENALKQATQTLDRLYAGKYLGMKATIAQTLQWPRTFAGMVPHGVGEWPYIYVDSDGNPRDFTNLQPETGFAEVELAASTTAGSNPYAQPSPRVNFDRSLVGSLEKEIRTTDDNSYRVDPLFKVNVILRPILKNTTGSVPITRGA
jgi:hypothetical protein